MYVLLHYIHNVWCCSVSFSRLAGGDDAVRKKSLLLSRVVVNRGVGVGVVVSASSEGGGFVHIYNIKRRTYATDLHNIEFVLTRFISFRGLGI